MQSASKTLKRVTLELLVIPMLSFSQGDCEAAKLTLSRGGNDPAIICGDVNIEKVAPMVP
jgi:hypothetical protein